MSQAPSFSSLPPEIQARLRVKRRIYWWCAVIIAVGPVTHPVVLGAFRPGFLGLHFVWALAFVALGAGVGAARLRGPVGGVLAGGISLAALMVEVLLSGGLASPFFPTLYTLPLIVAVFTPEFRLPVAVAIALTLGCIVLTGELSGAAPRALAAQVFSFAIVGMVSAHGAQTYRRLRDAETVAHQDRVRALQRLAESEGHRARAERERSDVERLVVVGQLAAGVAHEINNPLAYVKSNLSYLEEELKQSAREDTEEALRVLEETREGVLRIQQIVTDLRRFSRDDAGGEQACAVGDAIEEAQRLASVRLRSLGQVVREVSPELPRVRVSQRHLVQVLVNLLLNAADALESMPRQRPARVVLRAHPAPEGVRVEVEDNGPGIPESALPRLFEPFFTTKPPGKGTGLGLALCREYLARVGGTLEVENLPQGGARFILHLPVTGPVPAPATDPACREAPAPSPGVTARGEPVTE